MFILCLHEKHDFTLSTRGKDRFRYVALGLPEEGLPFALLKSVGRSPDGPHAAGMRPKPQVWPVLCFLPRTGKNCEGWLDLRRNSSQPESN